MKTKEYIVKKINRTSFSVRYTVARILVFKMCEPIQTHNGCSILFGTIDKDTTHEI